MRASKILHSTTSSSRSWLSRQSTDPYVKKRLTSSRYRSRSAFKLIEIDQQYGLFRRPDVRAVVDLGAAPGGWSQIVAGKLGWTDHTLKKSEDNEKGKGKGKRESKEKHITSRLEKEMRFDPLNIDDEAPTKLSKGLGTVVAVDLLPMDPIHGVLDIQADFLKPDTEDLIHRLLRMKESPESKADVILSDMAANSTGNDVRDIESSLEICEMVYDFATRHLRTVESIGRSKGGVLLMKYFTHPNLDDFRKLKLTPNFKDVKIVKPASSRPESKEAYFLCQGWKGFW
ncbi:Ribosomal RNA large subunit methyltransferase E [Leucoagaricus sp. SymC.cos]|nr:Ribosomal RNA large subunit methyltransferase E [Leucoagaricus sp. SymC.cos]